MRLRQGENPPFNSEKGTCKVFYEHLVRTERFLFLPMKQHWRVQNLRAKRFELRKQLPRSPWFSTHLVRDLGCNWNEFLGNSEPRTEKWHPLHCQCILQKGSTPWDPSAAIALHRSKPNRWPSWVMSASVMSTTTYTEYRTFLSLWNYALSNTVTMCQVRDMSLIRHTYHRALKRAQAPSATDRGVYFEPEPFNCVNKSWQRIDKFLWAVLDTYLSTLNSIHTSRCLRNFYSQITRIRWEMLRPRRWI